jgi:hypothetical protein
MEGFEASVDQQRKNALLLVRATEDIYMLTCEIKALRATVLREFEKMDFKAVKKKRTQRNRCEFIGDPKGKAKEGKQCQGYVCKKSTRFCHAHYVLASTPTNRQNLFSHSNDKGLVLPDDFEELPIDNNALDELLAYGTTK